MKSLYAITFLVPSTWALDAVRQRTFHLPEAPEPTPAPALVHVRQAISSLAGSGVATSADTCGWVSGLTAFPLSCQNGLRCAFNQAYNVAGCCPSSSLSCAIATRCYDSTEASNLAISSDPLAVACTFAASPLCKQWVYPDGFTALGCGVASTTDFVYQSEFFLSTTTTGFVFSSQFPANAAFSAGASDAAGVGSGSLSFPEPTGGDGNGNGSTNGASGGTSSSGNSRGSGISTGAIVGIAVAAAVVAVAAIVAIGIVCWKRSKRPSIVAHQQQPVFDHRPNAYPPAPSKPAAATVTEVGGSQIGGSQIGGSQLGGSTVSQPMTQANMNAMLAGQQAPSNEWAFVQKPVAQAQTAAANDDGIKVTEIMPDDAVDEQKPQQVYHAGTPVPFPHHPSSPGPYAQHPGSPGPMQHPGSPPPSAYHQQAFYPGTVVTSNVAPTAFSPTIVSHNVQNV